MILSCNAIPDLAGLIEALILQWQQLPENWNHWKLALLIADLNQFSISFRCDCLRDIASLSCPWVNSVLGALEIPKEDYALEVFSFVQLLVLENSLDCRKL